MREERDEVVVLSHGDMVSWEQPSDRDCREAHLLNYVERGFSRLAAEGTFEQLGTAVVDRLQPLRLWRREVQRHRVHVIYKQTY